MTTDDGMEGAGIVLTLLRPRSWYGHTILRHEECPEEFKVDARTC